MWRFIFAGLSASLMGIGLARFAYTPLLPVLIEQHWFSASAAVYLGAANLAGYLIGALLGRPLAARINNIATLRISSVVLTLAFLACAFPLSVVWFFIWRLLSGIAGGAIMVLVAATVLPHVPDNRKGVASGAIFLGIGLGIAASGTLVPLLLAWGLRETWLGLAVLSAVLTATSWTAWPKAKPSVIPAESKVAAALPPSGARAAEIFLYAEYALMALGLVPAMVFLVDFVSRGLGAGARLGSLIWVAYGAGACIGPPLYGFLADRSGARPAVRLVLLSQAIATALLALTDSPVVLGLLALVIGSFPPGMVPLVLAWLREILPGHATRQNIVWSRATTVFAAFQALGGYGFSALFNGSGGNHRLLFEIAAAAIAGALALELLSPLTARSKA